MTSSIIFLFKLLVCLIHPLPLLITSLVLGMWCWKKRWCQISIGLACLYVYLASTGLLSSRLYHYLDPTPKQVTVQQIKQHRGLILLGSGLNQPSSMLITPGITAYPRILEAARIYQQAKRLGLQYTLFISGGDILHNGLSEARVYAQILKQLGIPEQDMVLEERSLNTYQNAQYTKALLKADPKQAYLLVTSNYHMKRSQLYFKYFNIATIPATSDFVTSQFSAIPNSINLAFYDIALHEIIGIVMLSLYDALGLN